MTDTANFPMRFGDYAFKISDVQLVNFCFDYSEDKEYVCVFVRGHDGWLEFDGQEMTKFLTFYDPGNYLKWSKEMNNDNNRLCTQNERTTALY